MAQFRLEQRITATLLAVETALLDPAFLESLGRLPNLGRPELLRREEEGDVVHLDVRYAFAGELPSAVTAVVDPKRLTWVDEGAFDRAGHRSDHRIVPDHYGNRLTCAYKTTLREEGATVVRVAEGELAVRFPFVGSKVERAIVSGMAEHARHEEAALSAWLGG